MTHAPLRLRCDGAALTRNWQELARRSGTAACGAAVKADGYGLGARAVATRLAAAGCRDFFVATWDEALALADLQLPISVLHGVRAADMAVARAAPGHIRPVLNTAEQVRRWRDGGEGPCDVMVDTGMYRLGLDADAVDVLDGMPIATLMSHLACADEDHPLNAAQRTRFRDVVARVPAERASLANSAGIFLGTEYAFDLTRPGLALYGGVPRPEGVGVLRQVAVPQAQVLQCRDLPAGAAVGYNATYVAPHDQRLAILNIGYADGYGRGFSNVGQVWAGDRACPVRGRVSMDLLIVDVSAADVREGDWLTVEYTLPEASAISGRSQYELLTGLGARFDRVWD